MTVDEPLIEIDPGPVEDRRPLPRAVPVVMALVVGVVIGMATARIHEPTVPHQAPIAMHTVVVTEDGRSETFSMPSGSVVSTPAVKSSCSITVDGRFVSFISAVVGNAECGATVR